MRAFHLTFDERLGPALSPRIPNKSSNFTKVNSEPDIARICFSSTIIGCFYGIYANINKYFEENNYPHMDMYLYETNLDENSEYFVPTTTLTNDKLVWDAHVTKEVWWLHQAIVRKSRKIRIMNPGKTTKTQEVWTRPFNDPTQQAIFIAPLVKWSTLEQWGNDNTRHVDEVINSKEKPKLHQVESMFTEMSKVFEQKFKGRRLGAGVEDFDTTWDREFTDVSAGLEAYGTSSATIKEIFDRHLKHLTIDNKLGKKLSAEMYSFINKNDEHIRFFGGNLTGTYRIKFTSTDKNEILIHLLDLDADAVRHEVLQVEGVNSDWIISTDIFNMTMQYLVHCFYNTDMPTKNKMDAMIAVLMLLHFKLLGSILHQFFPYRVDERLAMATYAAMSMKFALKRLGTWYRAIDERCQDVIAHDSPHLSTIKRFNETEAIRYMIQDIQNRMRIRAKKIHAMMRMVADQDKRMQTVSGTVTLDGVVVVREINRSTAEYSKYLNRIVLSEREFIKDELITVIAAEMKSMPEVPLNDTLKAIVQRAMKKDKQFEELKSLMLAHLFEEMAHNPDLASAMKDPALFLNKLKYLYQSSKTTDPDVLKMRDLATKMVIKAVKIRTAATIASIRTGLQLYIVLRMLTMKKYG